MASSLVMLRCLVVVLVVCAILVSFVLILVDLQPRIHVLLFCGCVCFFKCFVAWFLLFEALLFFRAPERFHSSAHVCLSTQARYSVVFGFSCRVLSSLVVLC